MSQLITRKAYSTDVTDEQWAIIEPLVPGQKSGGVDRTANLREIYNAINYRTRTGCPWSLLPHDLPPKSTVFEYYKAWQDDGTWEAVHDELRRRVRVAADKNEQASAGIIDSQTVKTTETPDKSNEPLRGYDAGKKIKGRKRHVIVDTLGLMIVIVITAASVQDRDGAKLAFEAAMNSPEKTSQLEVTWADGGYSGKLVDWTTQNCPWKLEIVKRPKDAEGFKLLPKRWIVERTFGWLGRYRLLSKEYESTKSSSVADVHIAMSHLMLRRLTRKPSEKSASNTHNKACTQTA